MRMDPVHEPHIVRLTLPPGGGECFILGTAHVSRQSAEEAERCVRSLRPDVVVVELDEARYRSLVAGRKSALSDGDSAWKLAKLTLAGDAPRFAGAALYDVIGAVLASQPGAEFVAAIRAAEECGAVVVLGDRSARATLERLRLRLLDRLVH